MTARPQVLAWLVATLAAASAGDVPAQARVARVGVIASDAAGLSAPRVDVLRRRLHDLGHVEGRNIAFEVRYAGQHPDGHRAAAAELVALNVDVIVADGTASTRAAQRQTSSIPIVMVYTGDPLGAGFVKSLAHPGGNVTGQSFVGRELNVKAFELLVEALPHARRIGVLYDPVAVIRDPPDYRPLEDAARGRGVAVVPIRLVRGSDIDAALAVAGPALDAWVLVAIGFEEQFRLAGIAQSRRIPTICSAREPADAGCLMSYGPDFPAFWGGAAVYVDRILRGAKPADLPVEQPSRFEFIVNLRTAAALGTTLPASTRARADRAIE